MFADKLMVGIYAKFAKLIIEDISNTCSEAGNTTAALDLDLDFEISKLLVTSAKVRTSSRATKFDSIPDKSKTGS